MSNFIRRLRANVFQVFINNFNAAILRVTDSAIEIWIDAAVPTLLASVTDTSDLARVAQRIAAGAFDNDFRFDISEADEEGYSFLRQLATPSQIEIYASSMTDPYGFVQRERECQAERAEFPSLEERLDHYFEMGL